MTSERLTYSVPPMVRECLTASDLLGFDSVREAAEAVLLHADWEARWEAEPSALETLRAWRSAILVGNARIEVVS